MSWIPPNILLYFSPLPLGPHKQLSHENHMALPSTYLVFMYMTTFIHMLILCS